MKTTSISIKKANGRIKIHRLSWSLVAKGLKLLRIIDGFSPDDADALELQSIKDRIDF
jgi:muramidase (phage lysozyme)